REDCPVDRGDGDLPGQRGPESNLQRDRRRRETAARRRAEVAPGRGGGGDRETRGAVRHRPDAPAGGRVASPADRATGGVGAAARAPAVALAGLVLRIVLSRE